jgi:hypothetical protein
MPLVYLVSVSDFKAFFTHAFVDHSVYDLEHVVAYLLPSESINRGVRIFLPDEIKVTGERATGIILVCQFELFDVFIDRGALMGE